MLWKRVGGRDGSYPLDYYDCESTCGAKNADNELCCILGFSFGLLDFFGFRVQGLRKLVVTLDTMVWVHVWASLSTMCPLDVQFPVCNPFLARQWLRNLLLPVGYVFLQRILCSLLLWMILMWLGLVELWMSGATYIFILLQTFQCPSWSAIRPRIETLMAHLSHGRRIGRYGQQGSI